jgi:hypothetical protein
MVGTAARVGGTLGSGTLGGGNAGGGLPGYTGVDGRRVASGSGTSAGAATCAGAGGSGAIEEVPELMVDVSVARKLLKMSASWVSALRVGVEIVGSGDVAGGCSSAVTSS